MVAGVAEDDLHLPLRCCEGWVAPSFSFRGIKSNRQPQCLPPNFWNGMHDIECF